MFLYIINGKSPQMERSYNKISLQHCDWVLENQAGAPSFHATRARMNSHQIEEVGEKLRAMMPWIAKNKLVDKAKN